MSIVNEVKSALFASGIIDDYLPLYYLDENSISSSGYERTIVIRNSGNSGNSDNFARRPNFEITMIGNRNATLSDQTSIQSDADNLISYILNNYNDGNILYMRLIGELSGISILDTDRPFLTFSINAIRSNNNGS